MSILENDIALVLIIVAICLLIGLLFFQLFSKPSRASAAMESQAGLIPVLNVRDYGARGDGATDDTSAIQRAIDEALTQRGTVFFPPGKYKVTSELRVGSGGFITIQGAGGRNLQSTIEANLASGNVFEVTSTYCVRIADLKIVNASPSGRTISFTSGEGHRMSNIRLKNVAGNASAMVYYVGAFTEIERCSFVNQEPSAYAIHSTSVPSQININTNIFDNDFGGPGKGIIVDAASGTRPEGIKISRNNFILTGAEQITVKTILHIDISHNMLDQSSGSAILLDSDGLGLNGVFIKDNYISAAQDQLEGIGVHVPLRTEGATNLNISDNMIAYNGYGIKLARNTNKTIISNNMFTDTNHSGIVADGTSSTTITNNMFSSTSESLTISDSASGGPFIIKDNQLVGTNTIDKTDPAKFYIGDNPGL